MGNINVTLAVQPALQNLLAIIEKIFPLDFRTAAGSSLPLLLTTLLQVHSGNNFLFKFLGRSYSKKQTYTIRL